MLDRQRTKFYSDIQAFIKSVIKSQTSALQSKNTKNDGVELVYELQFRCTETDDKLVIKCATDPQELMDGPAPFSRTAFVDIGVDMEALPYPSPGNAERNQTRDTTEPPFYRG
ncbi:hypothetical protein CEXT_300121 [Caerostris extrusa]|uniref:Uncharacterized protein n=1 Tax=Caerostris extrusa TaxID=172846 RepID=A0AAV4NV95_CAEEX|nr:hypothetical protein CEXT_300121 [Caerostris extrusa]